MNVFSAVILNAGLAATAPAYGAQVAPQDPWSHGPGISIIDQFSGGFTAEVSSADKAHSLNRLTPHLRGSEKTTSSLPTMSLDVFEEIVAQIRAHQRSEAVQVDVPIENIQEVKRLTGLSSVQIASLLEVDRRSIYNWLQGGVVRERNAERIAKLLSVILYIDEGSAEANQTTLFASEGENSSIYELLKQGRFDDLNVLAPYGKGRANEAWAPQDRSMVQEYGLAFAPEGFVIDETVVEAPMDVDAQSNPVPPKRRKARKV